MGQRYIIESSKRSAIITSSVAVSTGKALMKRYLKLPGPMSLNELSWAQSLFKRMNFK